MSGKQAPLGEKAKGAIKRIEDLEKNLSVMIVENSRILGSHKARLDALELQVEALARLSGEDVVNQMIDTIRAERAEQARKIKEAQAAARKQALEDGVADGFIFVEEVIGEKSLLVVTEVDKDGNATADHEQFTMLSVAPEFREKLMGKGAGFKLTHEDGSTSEVNAIYRVDEAKAKALLEKKMKKAQEEAEAAAKAAADAASGDEQSDQNVEENQ